MKITDRSDEHLDKGIQKAIDHLEGMGLDFYIILTGIDSYMEKRRRKEQAETAVRLTEAVSELQQVVLEMKRG